MIIGLSAKDNKGLESEVDPRFGRANYFAVVDTANMEVRFIENTAADAASGAGVGAAQLIADQKVDVVISRNFGPRAFDTLKAANVKLYSFSNGTIKGAVNTYNDGQLKQVTTASASGHKH